MLFMTIIVSATFGFAQTDAQLRRVSYTSTVDESSREYLLYLPKGYEDDPDKKWPVMLFLHGNGERGNGRTELDFVMVHGPLYEAWIQKRDLPFIIIGPQLPMFGMDHYADYLAKRTLDQLPRRLEKGVPERETKWQIDTLMQGSISDENYPYKNFGPPMGWEQVEQDLVNMLDYVSENYQTDQSRVYLTGLSYGGFGTWYMGSKYPERFAAISPVVGWGHKNLMQPLAENKTPIWCFAGGRDLVIRERYFYPGLNELERLGHQVRFTIESDMGHDTWKRVYGGEDLYNWFLGHQK
ncbi:Prolyl oligopeptidase family protein [Reichenbachiella faecimaris]|uniref:Prolyl oligopeptidase family protein n=2 Tax=Reichenbachiella faecimaris TaxID=692418 RepID=A0A1W2GES2_REIFA|nr:Prolyl oligopeptidase family protein [Reichenbachiella faecimaris]